MEEFKTHKNGGCPNIYTCIILFCTAALFETAFLGLAIQVRGTYNIVTYLSLAVVLQIAACIKAVCIWRIYRYSVKAVAYIGGAVIAALLMYSAMEAFVVLTAVIAPTISTGTMLPDYGFIALTDALLSVVLLYGIQHWLKVMLKSEPLQLSSQIRHHFLFNTLNATVCRIKENPELAQANLERLANLFRKTLFSESYISLEEELASVKCYLEIEKYRLGERLQVDWFLDRKTNVAIKMPILILQPLVENAIYYGVEKVAGGGVVEISLCTVKNRLIIQVRNPICNIGSADLSRGNYIAQRNIECRLALAYGDNFSFKREQRETEYRATIDIPTGGLL